jgi:DNA-binding PadR family transcriptional regulator
MSMMRGSLGDVEHFVLVALLRLGGESYGVPILGEIADRTGREVSRPAVYVALRRLEEKGFLQSRLGDATAERGGRAKRYFKLTRAGVLQLQQSRDAFRRIWAGADHLLPRHLR